MQRERDRRRAEEELPEETRAWGGTPPSDRLREIWKAYHLAREHRPLLDALEDAAPDTRWAAARWIVRRTCVEAELDQVEWIAAALDGIDRGDDAWSALQIPAEASGSAAPDGCLLIMTSGWNDDLDLPSKATTIFSAFYDDDPLRVAINALWVARDVFGAGQAHGFVGELWRAFPMLRNPSE